VSAARPEDKAGTKISQYIVFIDEIYPYRLENLSRYSANRTKSGDCSWNPSFSARACIDKVLGALGLSDGTVRLSDIDRARAGLPANE
jgi:hypothetical protein